MGSSFASDAYARATCSDSTAIAVALSSHGVLKKIRNDYLSGYQALTVERLQTASQKAADPPFVQVRLNPREAPLTQLITPQSDCFSRGGFFSNREGFGR